MSQWSAFYQDRVGEGYTNYAKQRYSVLVDYLNTLKGSFREEGCGIATISKLLISKDRVCMDRCEEMLKLAYLNTFKDHAIKFIKSDILVKQGNVDNIFSHGVLEHFSDSQIKSIVARQREEANSVVHYVPTNGYTEPSFGDERLLSVNRWVELTSPVKVELFNDNKDLLLVLK